jgi:hypothetical protein
MLHCRGAERSKENAKENIKDSGRYPAAMDGGQRPLAEREPEGLN